MRVFRQVEPYLLAAVYAAIPLATLAADNADLVRLSDILPYYAGAVVVCWVAIVLVREHRGAAAARTAGLCTAIAVLLVFDYHELRPLLASVTNDARVATLYLWAILTGATVAAAAWLAPRLPPLPGVALVAGVLMLMPPGLRYAGRRAELARNTAPSIPTAAAAERLVGNRPRNVYFFLLDAYARADWMRNQFGFDNSAFVDELRRRGFVVPPRTRANYPVTMLSAPSILSMQYQGDPSVARPEMTGNSRVANTFRKLGYSFVLAPSGVEGWGCTGSEAMCIPGVATYASRIGMSDLDWAVLERTPGADLLQVVDPTEVSNDAAVRQFPFSVVESVTAERSARPMFVFAHSLLAHTPYPYQGRSCQLQSGEPTGADAYVGAVECANSNTLAAVRVIAHRDPGAVIVLASDHGSDVGSALAGVKPGSVDAKRRMSNFVALRLPRRCRDDVPPDLAAVNIFRVVVNCLTTSRMRMLRYRAVLS